MPRFVILYHELPADGMNPEMETRASHWDFMLEREGQLRTWALSEEPEFDKEIPARGLADHRIDYLEYEGPVSRNRGTVTRYDAGTFEEQQTTPTLVEVSLSGKKISGRVTLQRKSAISPNWIFRCY